MIPLSCLYDMKSGDNLNKRVENKIKKISILKFKIILSVGNNSWID
jgi:hypothetical protein